MDNIPHCNIEWQAIRIIPSRFPPIDLFERILDPDEYDVAFFIESLTNDRLRDEVGDLRLIPNDQRVSGPGTSPIMAAFTHIGHPSRFTDGTYGVYYAANDTRTAIAETTYHRARFLSSTNEPDTSIYMREYVGRVIKPMLDIRGAVFSQLHDPDNYAPSQAFAEPVRQSNHDGLLYNSVRHPGGQCIAVFIPSALAPVTQAAHYEYVYSASQRKIKHVLHVSEVPGLN